MTLSRLQCPVCGAMDAAEPGAAPSRVRCRHCGLLFAPAPNGAAVGVDGPAKATDEAWDVSRSPAPPVVIYGQSPRNGDAASVAEPGGGDAERDVRPVANGTAGSAIANDSASQPERRPPPGETAARQAPPLGPPPPYRPIAMPPKRSRPRPTMAPAPVPRRVAHLVGVLGPPPPYRPIVQAGAEFGRGPPPDLEPWRTGVPARAPDPEAVRRPVRNFDDEEEDEPWVLPREPDPAAAPPAPAPRDATRFERPTKAGPDDVPVVWSDDADAPHMLPRAFLRRTGRLPPNRRRRSWKKLAGVAMLVGLAGAVMVARQSVMHAFPTTVRLFSAVGLAPARSTVASPPDTAVFFSGDCGTANTGPTSGCADAHPGAGAK